MNKFISVCILSVLFVFSACKSKKKQANFGDKITFFDIANDTTCISTSTKPILIVLINEPSCTGCKENLAVYLNSLKSKFTQYALITSYPSTSTRKIYEKYLTYRFKKLSGTYYSINSDNSSFFYGDSLINIDTKKNPQIIIIKDAKTKTFSYEEIFSDTRILKSFKREVRSF